jgi:hypothetical protein
LKNIEKGDANRATTNTILGWVVNTLARTITFPAHRILRLHEVLDSIKPIQRHVSLLKWQKLVGGLRLMAIVIPDAIGLFSALQEEIQSKTPC